jgi:predicted nucleotidyltransferase
MMADHDRQILDQFAARVREQFPDADVWAFGSRARGDATWESDLDVCVVVDHLTNEDRYTLWNMAWEIGFEQDMLISAVPFSKDEFQHGPCSESPLVLNILREGIPA